MDLKNFPNDHAIRALFILQEIINLSRLKIDIFQ